MIFMDIQAHHSWMRGEFEISTDPARIDLAMVQEFLAESYWARGVPREVVQRSIEHSLCFGIYCEARQVGFARAITDCATFAYLADVFVIEEYRKRGLSKWLMECIRSHPDLQRLRRWTLITRDAHQLYRQFGFTELANPERWMEIHDMDVYRRRDPGAQEP
jgi:GNAT superfamily N-acetyltransferase